MKYLNQPITINHLTLNNRLVMPPMATAKSTPEGKFSEALGEYYKDRAKGGYIGLIITEHSYISQQGKASNGQLSIACDSDIEGLANLVKAAQTDGTKVMAQINHAGSAASADITGLEPAAPSPVKHPRSANADSALPHELSEAEIAQIVQQFADAALRAKKAGFDGVEIHGSHGYLLNQFYSPLTNHRTDRYSAASVENRVRIHLEVIAAVRKAVGDDYPVALRFGGCDYTAGGSTIEDSKKACLLFEQAGIDLLDISGGMYGYMVSDCKEPGYFQDMSSAIKQAVSVPVILTGGIQTAQEAELLLERSAADLIGVGRAMLKNARWAEENLTV